ncbi:MAG TPA: proline--tRNA ligase [candidate division Zixibacteria bacterium]|nr:proline--tRNA ligase [candidate division Zixibacteria bacterium]MDD4918681.1 proline--tRNA ligase [candidate division Zixibacteria bacterium]MDM7973092.1 proline--tRNA ligase [candidate division Zixibacteria bacterium]HOD66978.1 proline--tRNA ligase [candidate division Zixibacteria bacterium]HOZ07536.1 proline--tRNA ligase [candidate division Zixibacteria bacterium]
MRWTHSYIPTLRENQAEAELISHQLLLRGGYIRKLASGIYLYLPLMQRVIHKFSNIVREEMNRAGGLEIAMSVLCPAEVWQESGRYGTIGKEQMRLRDRHDHEQVLCGTHEETVTFLIRGEVKSYRQLPLNLYQIQVKFRDEIRPRFGLMRGREFIMKDAYSFDADEESFARSYQAMVDAYFRIFHRAGLDVVKVESDTGAMGGKAAHEFMLLVDTEAGEEIIMSCDSCDYTANLEKAAFCDPLQPAPEPETKPRETVDTPGAATIEEVTAFLKVPAHRLVKTLLYMADGKPVAALVRGDRELNETKLKNAVGANELVMAAAAEVEQFTGAPVGFAGPIGLKDVPIYADPLVTQMNNFIVGANLFEKHTVNVNLGRDFKAAKIADLTSARHGDGCPKCDGHLVAKHGIEVGNTFMLGTKYSDSLGAKFLDAEGKERPILMGSYGIGVTRTPQAALEKYHDERGICWPKNIAPYQVALIPLNMDKAEHRTAAENIYTALNEANIDVLWDDRTERAGVKFNDADLIGLPVRLVIGDKSLADGKVEMKARRGGEPHLVPIDRIVPAVRDLLDTLP